MKTWITTYMVLYLATMFGQNPIVLNKSSHVQMTIDHLDQKYIINQQSLIQESEGIRKIYQFPFMGALTHLDVRNPLEIVLFFDESNQMVILDNQLSEKFSFNFNFEFPEIDPVYVASASKKFYWVLDGITKQIFYLDFGNKTLRLISNPIQYEYHLIYSDANAFYWIENQKIFQIDIYGNMSENAINNSYDKIISFSGTKLIFSRENKIYSYEIKTHQEFQMDTLDTIVPY